VVLNLKGALGFLVPPLMSRKIDMWSNIPPDPTHCMKMRPNSCNHYLMRKRSSLLARLSSLILLFLHVGRILAEGISIKIWFSRICSKKVERGSTWA